MNSGFYKNDGGVLLYAPTYIINANYELHVEKQTTYTYPVDGWNYFATLQEACAAYNLDITPYLPPTTNSNPI